MNGSVAKDTAARTASARSRAIFACVLANLVDGFDVLAISFTAPFIVKEWDVLPETLGLIFGAGLAGITFGSLFLASLAERVGRRALVISCVVLMAASMGLCAGAQNVEQLMGLRFLTGLGVGGLLPTLNTTVAENAWKGRDNLSISLFTAAYPVGSLLGGWAASGLIETWSWRAVFVVGALLSGIVLVTLWRWLPGGAKIPPGQCEAASHDTRLFQPAMRTTVILLSLAFALHMFVIFFVMNWTPTLVEALGFKVGIGITALMLLNLGSLAGGLSFGPLADRLGWQRVAPVFTVCLAVCLTGFVWAAASHHLVAVQTMAVLAGYFIGGAMTSLYAMAPQLLPPHLRVSGTGLAIGIGRLGGMAGPVLAGWGLSYGLSPSMVFYTAAAIPLILTALIVSLARGRRGKGYEARVSPQPG